MRITYKGQQKKTDRKDKLKSISRSKLFLAGIVFLLIGTALVFAAFQLHSTYYKPEKTSRKFDVAVSSPAVYNFSMSSGNPYKMTFIMPSGQSLHYLLSEVKVRLIDNIPYTVYDAISGGTIENNSALNMAPVQNLTQYIVTLSAITTNSTNVTVNSVQSVTKELSMNPSVLASGAFVLVVGVAVVGFSISRALQ